MKIKAKFRRGSKVKLPLNESGIILDYEYLPLCGYKYWVIIKESNNDLFHTKNEIIDFFERQIYK